MRNIWIFIAVATTSPRLVRAQTALDTVPFVGCRSDGQTGVLPPPLGTPKVIAIAGIPRHTLAYYKGEYTAGVYAPRGWHCQSWYGSNGAGLVVSPDQLDTTAVVPRVNGPAIQLNQMCAGTSGRFDVAEYAIPLFSSTLAQFIARVRSERIMPDSDFSELTFASDSIVSIGPRETAFVTPAHRIGLGTQVVLTPNDSPVHGLAMVADNAEEPDIALLRVRLGAGADTIASALIRINRAGLIDAGC